MRGCPPRRPRTPSRARRGRPPPQPNSGKRARGRWSGSSVREILINPKYTGHMVWNRRA
ncbi:recombinase family protein, partial [Nocardia farcinica]|uniref:recombinase family protein n=1 Tax=Nocardia farcinica TaxID=37329 RepID=UPI003CC7F69A